MAFVDGDYSRADLARQSTRRGGFGDEKRRYIWLHLLDLQYLEDQLVSSTSKIDESPQSPLQSEASHGISTSDHEIPLDGEGWQIPHLSHLDIDQAEEEEGGGEEEQQDWTGQEWNIASSKRQKRRRGRKVGDFLNGSSIYTSPSATDTIYSTATMTIASNQSRNTSIEDLTDVGDDTVQRPIETIVLDRENLKQERKRRKKEKKRNRKGKVVASREDVEASGILLASSHTLEEEKDQEWVQTEDENKVEVNKHKDEQQVILDVNRSFIGMKNKRLQEVRREQLDRVIVGVLRRHSTLNYYQGYHDIISVLLVALIPQAEGIADIDKAIDVVIQVACRVSLHLLRDNMTVNMEPSMGHLKLVRNILRKVDCALSVEVESASPLPYFALPWLISLFAHDLDLKLSILVFDFILARGPDSVIFLAVALILEGNKLAFLEDAAEKHHSLSQLPSQITTDSLPFILQRADSLSEENKVELNGKVMGPRSVFATWKQLPILSSLLEKVQDCEIPTPWAHADALAEAILCGGTEEIVINSMPTAPSSDDGLYEKEYEKKQRKGSGKYKQKGGSLLAVMGAVGAVGVAALLMYGAARSGITII